MKCQVYPHSKQTQRRTFLHPTQPLAKYATAAHVTPLTPSYPPDLRMLLLNMPSTTTMPIHNHYFVLTFFRSLVGLRSSLIRSVVDKSPFLSTMPSSSIACILESTSILKCVECPRITISFFVLVSVYLCYFLLCYK